MNATSKLNDAQEAEQYQSLTGLQLIAEKEIADFVTSNLGVANQWMHEATEISTGDMLFCEVKYNHATTGTWKAVLVQRQDDGTYRCNRLARMPSIRKTSKTWNLTMTGWLYRSEGRL